MQYLWLIFGAVSFILAGVNIFVSLQRKRTTALKLLTVSLIFGMLALLSQCAMVDYWVGKSDWSALADVVPGMYNTLTAAVLLCGVLNVTSVIILLRRKK